VEAPVVLPPSAENSLFGYEVDPSEVTANRRGAERAVVQAALPPLIALVVIAAIINPFLAVAVAALGGAAAWFFLLERAGDGGLGALIGGRVVTAAEEPRLANLVDAMVATVGLSTPTLVVVDDAVPNACSYGSGASATVVVTRGLLDTVDLVQLEGVIAHELAHLRRGDGQRAVVVYRCAPFTIGGWNSDRLHRLLGLGRELRADQIGAASVRYPIGIADALERCAAAPAPTANSAFAAKTFSRTRWLWFDPMVHDRSADAAVGNHDATSLRIAVLEEW
jgi:Zn-dependent protease with chaperone function